MSSTGSWNTQDIRPWSPPQTVTTKDITFAKPFVAPPRLPHGLNSLDIDKNFNIRIVANAESITKAGFKASLNAWADTKLYSAGDSWLELAPGFLEYQTGEFSTQDDHPWDKPQLKTSRRINFDRPYITPPKVIVFLKQLDLDKSKNWRVIANVSDIDANGFTIHIDTWGDSILYSATAGWIAYPGDRPYVFSGAANTQDVRPWNKPQLLNSKSIGFDGVQFWRNPSIFLALYSLDFDYKANLRIKASADNVTPNGLTWHLDSWGDSIFYSAGVSILAVV